MTEEKKPACSKCEDTKYVQCPECEGQGNYDCDECSGTGDCPSCGFAGSVIEDGEECDDCYGDDSCSSCGGDGNFDCEECELSTGRIKCPACNTATPPEEK